MYIQHNIYMNSACTHIIREEILLICQLVHFFVTNMPIIEKAYRNNINSKHFHIVNFILYWACEGLHLSLVCIHKQLCTAVLCSDSITCGNESWNVLHFGLIEQDLDTANQVVGFHWKQIVKLPWRSRERVDWQSFNQWSTKLPSLVQPLEFRQMY